MTLAPELGAHFSPLDPSMSDPVTVLLVDLRIEARRDVAEAIENVPGMTVVGEASNPDEALREIALSRPDVAVLGRTPHPEDMSWCVDLCSADPHTHCLVRSSENDDETVLSALYAGAAGFLLEETSNADLIEAIRVVARGGSMLDPAVTETVLSRIRRLSSGAVQVQPTDALNRLTAPERRLLELITEGLSNREIGERLASSEQTVKNHVSRLLSVLWMQRRSQVAALGATLRNDGGPAFDKDDR